jgi:histidinol-phosphatase (PHP family)
MSIAELIPAAVNAHISAAVITEHYDDDFPHEISVPMTFDLDEYYHSFLSWQKNCPPELSLRLGIEFGYQNHLCSRYKSIANSYPFDSIILSNHLFEGKDPYYFRDCYDLPKEALHEKYIHSLSDMIESCDCFDILGHYDYIVRYSPLPDPSMKYKDCPEAFDRLFRLLIRSKKSLEINTRTINKLFNSGVIEYMPDADILKRYIDLGGQRITLGSDSHDSDTLACHFESTSQYLMTLGISNNSHYVNRQEVRNNLT